MPAFDKHELPNGLTIIAERGPHAQSAALGFFVRTGARDESTDVAGVSHFLEHMMFKGTETRSAADVNREFDQMGAQYNAFTSEENTVYWAAVLPEQLPAALDLLGDMLRPSLRQQDFDTEKNVILEEINMYQDMPHFSVYESAMSEYFAPLPLGQSVLGSVASIKALSRDQMQTYFNSRYAPNNITLAVSGQFQSEELFKLAERRCGHWQSDQAERKLQAAPGNEKQVVLTKSTVTREHLAILSPAPAGQDESRFAAALLGRIIGDAASSRLYWALVDNALADTASFDYDAMDGTGAFVGYLSCDPARAAQVLNIYRDTLAKVVAEGVSEAELEAAKNKAASGMTLRGEIPQGRLTTVGFNWVYRREYRSLQDDLDAVMAVSTTQISALLEKYSFKPQTVVALGPLEKLE